MESSNNHDPIMVLSNDSFPDQQQLRLHMNFADNIQRFSHSDDKDQNTPLPADFGLQNKQEKLVEGGRKRKRNNEKDEEKPNEVIHVRAKRGQATNSHCLAERVRRKKINERLRCLRDLVPGCYKAMGMAVMLDVVISYVQSLQNQIEFLSMKLSAASMFNDFNWTGMDATESMQGTNANDELQEMEKMLSEGHAGLSCNFNPTWPL
ncbi:hypothetical protein UlMin_040544 [Ulmus minor]